MQILVSLRVFGTECLYICSFSYRLGLWIKKFAKNAVACVLVWSLIRGVGGGVSLALISRSPLRLVFTSDRVGVGVVSEVVRTLMTK